MKSFLTNINKNNITNKLNQVQKINSNFVNISSASFSLENMVCFNCGQKGHRSKDCTEGTTCYRCGQKGHISKNCSNEDKGNSNISNRRCFNCGQTGHLSKECNDKKCHKCGKTGHLKFQCTE